MSETGPTAPLGIMLYGYSQVDAATIRDAVSRSSRTVVELLSATGMEDSTVSSILESGGSGSFSGGESKMLMFLGFDDDVIGKAMDDLKAVQGIDRPIFCCLTEENVNWTLRDLIIDLQAEDRYWKERGNAPPSDPQVR